MTVTTSDVLNEARRELAALDGLDERSQRLRQEWRDRAELTRDQLAALAAELGDYLGERATAAREVLLQRYHELEDELPIEEYTQRAQRGAWQVAQVVLSAVFALPALLVRSLRALSSVADDVAVRGADLSERGRELVAAVPPSRRVRRRARGRLAAVGVIGFGIGLVTGWVLAQRDAAAWESASELTAGWDAAPATTATTGQHDEAEASEPEAEAGESDAGGSEAEAGEPEEGRSGDGA